MKKHFLVSKFKINFEVIKNGFEQQNNKGFVLQTDQGINIEDTRQF